MGWALENLGSSECRQIAEGLFEVEKVFGGKKLHGLCPVHGEKSASFVYNFEEDWCKCKSCSFGGDLVKLWAEVTGHDHQDIRAFKEEFGEGSDTFTPSNPRKKATSATKKNPLPDVFIYESVFAALQPLPPDRVQEMMAKRGWTQAALDRLDLREFVAFGKHRKVAFPVRDEQGRLCNIRLYQPGAKQMKVISWYDERCHVCGSAWGKENKQKICPQCQSLPVDYGRTRLVPAPQEWTKETVWLVEGEPDLVCALSRGLNAVTQTAGAGTWDLNAEEFNPHFSGRDVVIAYDADITGYKGAMKVAKSLAGTAKSVRVLIWPAWMSEALA
jgi:hypothetical protein